MSLPTELLVAAGILAVILLVSLLGVVLSRKPDPKAVLLLSLLENLPREEEGQLAKSEGIDQIEQPDTSSVGGPRSPEFLA